MESLTVKGGALLFCNDTYQYMKDKLLPKSQFPMIVGLTALLIAGCAAGFSVYGLMILFGGSISLAIVFGALEWGKLIATTYLYRYWTRVGTLLKSYMTLAIVVLMLVTSLGIFGFLGSSYKKSSLEYTITQNRIQMVESQKEYHLTTIANATERINVLNEIRKTQEDRISSAQTNSFLTRNPIQLQQLQQQTAESINQANIEIGDRNKEIKTERESIQKLDEQIGEMRMGSNEKKDIQTLQYVADQIGWELDKVAFWFMIAIIFVFDPLAVALILAYNVAVFKKEQLDEINPQLEPPKSIVHPAFDEPHPNIELGDGESIPEIITDAERNKFPKY